MSTDTDNGFYNWQRTFAYDAPVNIIVSWRGRGKTYGLRKQMFRDWLKFKSRFVNVSRTVQESKAVCNNFFEKLVFNREPEVWDSVLDRPKFEFKVSKDCLYIRPHEPELKKNPYPWEVMGYFVALNSRQLAKQMTYVNVYRIVFDEAVLIKKDRFHKYLDDECAALSNVINSCTREAGDLNKGNRRKPRLYLLGNSCDLLNPYFIQYGVYREPTEGYRWYNGKTVLVHYEVPDEETSNRLMNETLSGILGKGTSEEDSAFFSKFDDYAQDMIAKKPREAYPAQLWVYNNKKYTIWYVLDSDMIYVYSGAPKDGRKLPTYALTTADNRVDYYYARTSVQAMKAFMRLFYGNHVRYESVLVMQEFLHALEVFGVH